MTIKEIAALAGTSKTTISFYLNGKFNKMSKDMKNKIEQVIKKNDYIPNHSARELRSRKTKLIGVVVGNIVQDFSSKLFHSINSKLEPHGFQILIFESNLELDKEKKIYQTLKSMNAHCMIIQSSIKGEAFFAKENITNMKIIVVDSKGESNNISYIYPNSKKQIKSIIKKYNKTGIKEILLFTQNLEFLQQRQNRKNEIEFLAKEKGLKFTNISFEKNEIEEQKIIDALLKRKLTTNQTLFWCNNNNIAFTFVKTINDLSMQNINLKIVSFDKCDFQKLILNHITVIDTITDQIGFQAAELILTNEDKNIELETLIVD